MGRNNYAEWYEWAAKGGDKYDAVGEPEWDYSVNPKAIEAYWQERINEQRFQDDLHAGVRGVRLSIYSPQPQGSEDAD